MSAVLPKLEEWAERWPGVVDLLAASGSVLAGVVAVVAVIYAKRQVDHARDERRERDRPFVTVALQPSHNIVANIVIKNEGATLARNVRFSFDPEWESSDPRRTKIRDSKMFREGIPTLVPGQSFRVFADMFPDRYKTDLPSSYEVKVSCEGPGEVGYEETYVLDFDVFHGYSTATLYDTHDVADSLRKINQRMAGWTERVGGPLSMVVRNGDKADAEEAAEIAERRQRIEDARSVELAMKENPEGTQHDILHTTDASTNFQPQHPITRPVPVQRDDEQS